MRALFGFVVMGFLLFPLHPAHGQSVGLFTVYGRITGGGDEVVPPGISIKVERIVGQSTVRTIMAPATGFPEKTYSILFFDDVDYENAASVGDQFRATCVVDSTGEELESSEQVVTAAHLESFALRIDLTCVWVAVESKTLTAVKRLYVVPVSRRHP